MVVPGTLVARKGWLRAPLRAEGLRQAVQHFAKVVRTRLGGVADQRLLTNCLQHVQKLMQRAGSLVVRLGDVRVGVCRHRSMLLKVLIERCGPPLQCRLVRGQMAAAGGHAWNVVRLPQKRSGVIGPGDTWAHFVVDLMQLQARGALP